jgi:hypothetical protein
MKFSYYLVLNGVVWIAKTGLPNRECHLLDFLHGQDEHMKELLTVIAGTGIGITSLDLIVSAVIKDEKEIPADMTQFDVLLPADVKLILDKVRASASEYFPHLKAIGTPSEQVLWKLQGRPRISMRYVQNLVRSNV